MKRGGARANCLVQEHSRSFLVPRPCRLREAKRTMGTRKVREHNKITSAMNFCFCKSLDSSSNSSLVPCNTRMYNSENSRTLSVSSMTVLSKESFSMLGVLVNRDVNSMTSVFSALLLSMFCAFHRITSSIQLRRAVRDRAWFVGSRAIYSWVSSA